MQSHNAMTPGIWLGPPQKQFVVGGGPGSRHDMEPPTQSESCAQAAATQGAPTGIRALEGTEVMPTSIQISPNAASHPTMNFDAFSSLSLKNADGQNTP